MLAGMHCGKEGLGKTFICSSIFYQPPIKQLKSTHILAPIPSISPLPEEDDPKTEQQDPTPDQHEPTRSLPCKRNP